MAKKKKSAEDIIYEIKDLLDDLQLKLDPDDAHVAYEDELDEDDLDLEEDSDEEQIISYVGSEYLAIHIQSLIDFLSTDTISSVMKKKKNTTSATSVRLSAHEKLCAERMQTLIKTIDELRVDVKDLRADMNKGKGVIAFLMIVGGLVGSILAILKFVK